VPTIYIIMLTGITASGICGDPIHLPGLSAIGGDCLFEAIDVCRNLRDDEANQDNATVVSILAIEDAATAEQTHRTSGLSDDHQQC
jgi:hypothetical protein